jgi:SAM-dependent methyltransferase
MADDLYDDPELYDLVSPPDAEMEQFYASVAGGPGREVLELACGTGRLTRPVAASGAYVVAGDLSEGMLTRARVRVHDDIEFIRLDMRNFELGRRFDAVFSGANSLLHLRRREDFAACFGAIARHLKPGGVFAFDVFVPSVGMLARAAGKREPMNVFQHSRLGEVRIEESIDYDPVTQISHVEWFWSTAAQADFRRTRLEMRQIFPQELPLLLESGGLRLVERFGGFDRSPLTARSRRQVCIAELG